MTGEFENALKAEACLKTGQTDLVFLDIEMPKLSGLGCLKKSTVKPLVILTTAFLKYALDGYELDIIDYFLKPISFSRFLKAVQKAKDFVDVRITNRTFEAPSWMVVCSDKRIEKPELSDILYIESIGNYININTKDKSILAYVTLKGIENKLPATDFIKVHQSFLINFAKIEAIEGSQVKINGKMLLVGRSYKDGFMKMIEERW